LPTFARDYGVLIEEEGIALRGLFLIDPKGTLRYVKSIHVASRRQKAYHACLLFLPSQITVNDLPVGRSVEETIRLVKAFQFTVRLDVLIIPGLR